MNQRRTTQHLGQPFVARLLARPGPLELLLLEAGLREQDSTELLVAALGRRAHGSGSGAGPGSGLSEAEVAERYQWLRRWLTPRRVRELVPEAAHLEVAVHQLPNLAAVNVVIRGLLGRGVADSTSLDPQAKGLAEQLRARRIRDPSART